MSTLYIYQWRKYFGDIDWLKNTNFIKNFTHDKKSFCHCSRTDIMMWLLGSCVFIFFRFYQVQFDVEFNVETESAQLVLPPAAVIFNFGIEFIIVPQHQIYKIWWILIETIKNLGWMDLIVIHRFKFLWCFTCRCNLTTF